MSRLMPLLMLALSGPALAQDDPAPAYRAALIDVLNTQDVAPTRADYQALGDGVGAELLAVAQDPTQRKSTRSRAIRALTWYPSDEVRSYLESTLADPAVDSIFRRRSAWSLAGAYGTDALPVLEAALADEDLQVRIATIKAVDSIGAPQATAALKKRIPLETEDAGKAALTQALEN